ncbi:2-nitropropane dioxygenase NPD [Flexistipes sinusarabici DSM 4947]|uniref:2-nitropropane dioxygenase NPD n=2 Tax=Flexistipes sinusarabici TaxID=2352 RepID=F8E581_FLESM|nr:nitronate monooxygenase [Flexistipes sinusarabici]AEI14577.1 2-nitropropane dioxygenase NPD [Flexistipes sinusarabici DSM 4947]
MLNNKLTKTLGIKYPIIQGGMMWISNAELAANVSEAGGLGIITALSFDSPEKLADELDKARLITDKPLGVNLTFLPTLNPVDYDSYIDVIIEKNIKIIETAGRNPEKYISRLKGNCASIIHKCTSVRHAVKAEKIGCDFVSIDGFECAGHPGEDDVTSLILIPKAADSINIPVIASGGFADGRGLAAALCLGASGVNMGTRFMLTRESPVHENLKKHLLSLNETDTILVERSLKNTLRAIRNSQAQKIIKMEERNATLQEMAPLLSGKNGKKAIETGDFENALIACGQCIGLINNIPSVKDMVQSIVEESTEIIKKLNIVDD